MAKLVRYFHQSPDYWLDTCTMRDWTRIWSRELLETPSADDFAVMYFKYEPPGHPGDDAASDEVEEWECPYPDVTE